MKGLTSSLSTATLLVLGLGGCAQILGFDDVSETSSAVDAANTAVDASVSDAAVALPDASTQFMCADSETTPGLGTTAIDTEMLNNDVSLSCVTGLDAPDQILSWTAPVTDYFVIDTSGSSFDTVIGVFDECDGTELACNNNLGELPISELVLRAERDDELLLVVDGFAGDQGVGSLNIARVSCPDTDLQSQEGTIPLSTTGFGDDQSSACGGQGQEDRSYHWVAPRDGLFAFRAKANGFRPIVSIQEGARCEDRELGCSQAQTSMRLSEVTRRLVKDEVVSITVDGVDGSGAFDLDIVDRSAETCPKAAYADGATESFTTRNMSPSCGFAEFAGEFGVTAQAGDMSYSFELGSISQGCSGSCTFDIVSEGLFVVSVLDQDDCGGEEIMCLVATFDPMLGMHTAELVLPNSAEAKNLTIIVSSQDNRFNGFSITSGCGIVC